MITTRIVFVCFLSLLFLFTSQLLADSSEKIKKIDEIMKAYNRYRLFNGVVLIAENGKVIYQNGFGMADFEKNIPNKTIMLRNIFVFFLIKLYGLQKKTKAIEWK